MPAVATARRSSSSVTKWDSNQWLSRAARTSDSRSASLAARALGDVASLLLADGWRGTRACYIAPPDDLLGQMVDEFVLVHPNVSRQS